MKILILFLLLIAAPFARALAEEGTPCGGGGDGSSAPTTPSTASPSGDGSPTTVGEQIGLTGSDQFCEYCTDRLVEVDGEMVCPGPGGCEPYTLDDMMETGVQAAQGVVKSYIKALANFPSYQFDGDHAPVPGPTPDAEYDLIVY